MIVFTQLVYLKPGKEEVFDQFEEVAIPVIRKYGGTLLLRVRPQPAAYLEAAIETPYEIHLVEFGSDDEFQSFLKDETRKRFLHWKEDSIRTSILIKGVKV
jgi:uncharacterized protein (DUF1330 family)